jgi:hypothetical protein
MEHRMILMDADFKTVHKIVIARRKNNAGMAESERTFRTGEYTGENPVTGSTFDESE